MSICPLTDNDVMRADVLSQLCLPFLSGEEVFLQVHSGSLALREGWRNSVSRIYLKRVALSNSRMIDIDEIRRENLRQLEIELGGPAGAANALSMSTSQFINLREGAKDSKTGRRRGMRKETARRIEAAAGKPPGWLDIHHSDGLSPSSNSPFADLPIQSDVTHIIGTVGRVPLIGWDSIGMLDESRGFEAQGLVESWASVFKGDSANAYAVRVEGDSMTAPYGGAKSYPEGSIIIVDPDRRTPESGRRVIARLSSGQITFKTLIEEDGRRWLKPLNPLHQPIHDEFEVLGTVIAKHEPE